MKDLGMADGATATFDAAAAERASADQADAVAAEAFDDVERLFQNEGLRELLDVSEDDEAKVGAILQETLAELQAEARGGRRQLDVSLAELKDALKGKLDSPENRAYFEQEAAKAAEVAGPHRRHGAAQRGASTRSRARPPAARACATRPGGRCRRPRCSTRASRRSSPS